MRLPPTDPLHQLESRWLESLDSWLASVSSFWEFLGTNGGILGIMGVVASVLLGCLALYYASGYQRATATDLSANHDQLLAQFSALTGLLGEGMAELVAQAIGERATSVNAVVGTLKAAQPVAARSPAKKERRAAAREASPCGVRHDPLFADLRAPARLRDLVQEFRRLRQAGQARAGGAVRSAAR